MHRVLLRAGRPERARESSAEEWCKNDRLGYRAAFAARRWRTRDELRIAIITWIERTYHRRRRQARLGRLTPIEYETIMNPTVTLAA